MAWSRSFGEGLPISMPIRPPPQSASNTRERSAGNAQLGRIGTCTAKSSYLSGGNRGASPIAKFLLRASQTRAIAGVSVPARAIKLCPIDVEDVRGKEAIVRGLEQDVL